MDGNRAGAEAIRRCDGVVVLVVGLFGRCRRRLGRSVEDAIAARAPRSPGDDADEADDARAPPPPPSSDEVAAQHGIEPGLARQLLRMHEAPRVTVSNEQSFARRMGS